MKELRIQFRFIVLVFTSIIFHSCQQKELHSTSLVERNDLVYEVNKTDPYTGKVFQKYSNDQFEYIGQYREGLKDGSWASFYENGQIEKESQYENGKLNGLSISYRDDGSLVKQEEFLDGKRHGESKFVRSNGYYSITNFEMNTRNGSSIDYNKAGKPVTITSFKEGHLNGDYTEYFDGTDKVKLLTYYAMGQQEGVRKSYWQNGKLKSETTYVKNEKKKQKDFDQNGNLTLNAIYPGTVAYYKSGKKIAEGTCNRKGLVNINSLTVWFSNRKLNLSTLNDYVWTSQGERLKQFSPVRGTYYISSLRKRWFEQGYYREADVSEGSYRPKFNGKFELVNHLLPSFAVKVQSGSRSKEIVIRNWSGKRLEVEVNGRKEFWTPKKKK